MAEKYKLTYFNIMGLGEPIRFMLSYMGIDFDDFRISSYPEFASKYKPNMPFGKMPVLEIGNDRFYQSIALCRYLGKQTNLGGDNLREDLEIDMIIESISDVRSTVWTYFYNRDEQNKEKIKPKIMEEIVPMYMKKFDEIIEKDGFLANKKLSWADVYFVAILGYFSYMIKDDICKKYEHIRDLRDRIHDIPNIKAWVESRPVTSW
ncbi:glutathione [Nesidiocoris tenuis]|uniref:glutathione transferase n=1 Tax=Nesidiocoris tenuis TaxID=355587 RepID=A0ABN7B0W2_9HEMI|nr:glutathione [Nesidiocoris tenuis]